MTEMIIPMDTKAAYEAACQAIKDGCNDRLRELLASAPFLITNEKLREPDDPLLNYAIAYGPRGFDGLSIVETLIELGVDINYCPSWGQTALGEAAFHLDVTMVGLLLKRGADPNILQFPDDENDPATVLDIVDWDIAYQEIRRPYESDHDPGDVLPIIRAMLIKAGAKGYYELHPEELN